MTVLGDTFDARSIAAIPPTVRLLAEFPGTYGPDPPADAPVEKLARNGHTILLLPGPGSSLVEAYDLTGAVEETVDDVRALLRNRRRTAATWFTSSSTRPRGLRQRLLDLGMVPPSAPPWEPSYAAMVLVQAPPAGPADVVARRSASLYEFDEAHELESEVMEMAEEDRQARREMRESLWQIHESDDAVLRVFVAFLEGRMVGVGRSLLSDVAVNLSGGAVRPDARGRGVYRALVRARWDDAVARGTGALTVQAGAMSRPILERLGFTPVGEQHCLLDRLDER